MIRKAGKRIKKHYVILALAAAVIAQLGSARADQVYSDVGAWEAAVGTFTETTSLGVPNGTLVNSATLADGTTLAFAQTLQVASIGAGWATWCCSYGGNVLESYGTGSWTTENWTISPVSGFGMYIEPDNFSNYDITLTLSSGDTLTESVQGDSGASFFGWAGSDVTNLSISSADNFAEGDWFSSPATATATPEPRLMLFLIVGIACLVGTHRLKIARNHAND